MAVNKYSDYLKKRWAGVEGVHFPGQDDTAGGSWQQSVTKYKPNIPDGWQTTQQLIDKYEMSRSGVYKLLKRNNVQHCAIQEKDHKFFVWEPDGVRIAFNGVAQRLETVPEGWCLTTEAEKMLGVGDARLLQVARREHIQSKKVVYKKHSMRIWEIESIKRAIANRAERGVVVNTAKDIACPSCGAKGTLEEATQGLMCSPIFCIHKTEDGEYVYKANYKARRMIEAYGAETVIRCKFCEADWPDIDAVMSDIKWNKEHSVEANSRCSSRYDTDDNDDCCGSRYAIDDDYEDEQEEDNNDDE